MSKYFKISPSVGKLSPWQLRSTFASFYFILNHPQQRILHVKSKGPIILKLMNLELWFMCTAHCSIEVTLTRNLTEGCTGKQEQIQMAPSHGVGAQKGNGILVWNLVWGSLFLCNARSYLLAFSRTTKLIVAFLFYLCSKLSFKHSRHINLGPLAAFKTSSSADLHFLN